MRRRPPLAAPVSGFPAWWLAHFLGRRQFDEEVDREEEAGRLHPERAAALRVAAAQVREAAAQWQQWNFSDLSVELGRDASVSEVAEQIVPRSLQEITPGQAAALLKVSPARVRQLLVSGALSGRRIGGRWLITRQEIDAYQARREEA